MPCLPISMFLGIRLTSLLYPSSQLSPSVLPDDSLPRTNWLSLSIRTVYGPDRSANIAIIATRCLCRNRLRSSSCSSLDYISLVSSFYLLLVLMQQLRHLTSKKLFTWILFLEVSSLFIDSSTFLLGPLYDILLACEILRRSSIVCYSFVRYLKSVVSSVDWTQKWENGAIISAHMYLRPSSRPPRSPIKSKMLYVYLFHVRKSWPMLISTLPNLNKFSGSSRVG